MNADPGWYNAQGDAPGTVRWWDGSQWVGEPQVQPATAPAAPSVAAPVPVPPPVTGFPASPPQAVTTMIGEAFPDRSPIEWVKLAISRWKDFEGRSRRSEYWWFAVAINVFQLIAFVPAMILVATETSVGTILGLLLLAVAGIVSLLGIIPTISVSIRRLHDTNRSGWFLLLSLIPCVSLVLLIFMFMEGTRGPNQYGVDPKA